MSFNTKEVLIDEEKLARLEKKIFIKEIINFQNVTSPKKDHEMATVIVKEIMQEVSNEN